MSALEITPIAYIYNDFPTKFGLPRQSGMSRHLISRIVMEKRFSNPEAFRGIEDFEYLWLVWLFEPMGKREWSPTVRPPCARRSSAATSEWVCSLRVLPTVRTR